ncbi:GT4 family glycosyltransferase PelF [bacterium]|nr:GT4 family glycosyltransferase PelF [bacterium]
MGKTNILQIISTLDIGGAERQLVELVKRLDKDKYNITVCCITRGGPFEEDLRKLGIEYHILYKKFKLDFTVIFRLIHLIRRKKIDLVHTWMFTSNTWGRIAAWIAGVPVIIAEEHGAFYSSLRHQISVDKLLLKCTDKIITVSDNLKESVERIGKIPHEKIIAIHNGIDINEFSTSINNANLKNELKIDSECPVVGIVARLDPLKDHESFLKAAGHIVKELPEVRFLIVGDGELMGKLESLAGEIGLREKVIFAGFRQDINNILSIIDVFVLCSTSEALGIAILEAMACSKPVVATNVGGIPEVVDDGRTGILVPPENPQALADGIIRLLKNKEEARRMGLAGRKRVEQYFDINFTVEKTEQIYERLLQKKFASFSFGENWLRYIKTFNKENLREARLSLQELLGIKTLKGKSFIDIGCGSGIFSLAAIDMNAQKVISLDNDQKSVESCNIIKRRNDAKHWFILNGSILDKDFFNNLGKEDIVYAWGVLHHTGNMWKAIDSSAKLVKKEGLFALAIYNRHWASGFWLKFKKLYNSRGKVIQKIMVLSIFLPRVLTRLMKLKHPFREKRGMSIYYDAIDWAGGFPYEYADFDEIVSFLKKRGFILINGIQTKSMGCNQFVFKRAENESVTGKTL